MVGITPKQCQGLNDGNGYGSLNIVCHAGSIKRSANDCHCFFTKNLTTMRSYLTAIVNNLRDQFVV